MSGKFLLRRTITNKRLLATGIECRLTGADKNQALEILETMLSIESDWPEFNYLVFIPADETILNNPILEYVPAKKVVLKLPQDFPVNKDIYARCSELNQKGILFALDYSSQSSAVSTYEKLASYVCLDTARLSPTELESITHYLKRPRNQYLATHVETEDHFSASSKAGIGNFSGNWFLKSSQSESKKIKAAQGLIIEILQALSEDATVMELKQLFKRDADLTFKLLKHINTARFGHREIDSIRRAIELLGRVQLQRWLSVLLVTEGSKAPPVVKGRAILHGRFAEILAHEKKIAEQDRLRLFITGAFSLLDTMFGEPMEKILDPIPLATPIEEALLERKGDYAPYLKIIESAENDGKEIPELARSLGLTAKGINEAHLKAICWTGTIKDTF